MDIRYSKQAIKYLAKLELKHKKAIVSKIKDLPDGDVKSLTNDKYAKRLRIGGFRVLFDQHSEYIFIGKIKHRGDVYK